MKTQYKNLIVFGLLLFSFLNLNAQSEEKPDSSPKDSTTIGGAGFQASSSNGGNETGAFDIGLQGDNFVAMPSPNSMTLVQQIEAGADLYTGKVQSSVPITSLSSYDISVPVTLSYSNNGIKVDDIGGWVGMGWDLQAGGKITRIMHNLPDEFRGDLHDNALGRLWGEDIPGYGYLNLLNAEVDGNGFGVGLGGFYSVYSQNDKQTIVKYADWKSCDDCEIALDTEPDEFYFNFGSYSGKFVFDQSGYVHTIPDMNLEITKTISTVNHHIGSGATITKFTVKTPEGMIYTFGSSGSSLDGVETSMVTQTSLATRYEYKHVGSSCTPYGIDHPDFSYSDPDAPCGDVVDVQHYYQIEPVLNYIDIEENGGLIPNDWNVENEDLAPVIDHLEGEIKNSVSKKLGHFSSTWHLKSITSPSGDHITFTYENEIFRFTQSRNYSWDMPNFKILTNSVTGEKRFESYIEPVERYINYYVDTDGNPNNSPNYLKYYPELASLVYNLTEIDVNGKRLSSITASNGRSLAFVPTINDRVDLHGAKALQEIEFRISGIRKKSWELGFQEDVKLSVNTPQWQSAYNNITHLSTEDVLDLDFNTIPAGQLSASSSIPYLQSFKSMCDFKHEHWHGENPFLDLQEFYQKEYEELWKPEHNRFYLDQITENGKNSESRDLVNFDYYSQNALPKRFSYKQDDFGFYNYNDRSTLLTGIPYDVNLNAYRTLPYEDLQTSALEYKGHYKTKNTDRAKSGILKKINFHTGAKKEFNYEGNEYGVRLSNVLVTPAGTPKFRELYTYNDSKWISQGGLNPGDIRLKQYTGIPLNHKDDKWVLNSYQNRPAQMSKGTYKVFRTVKKSIVDENNQGLGHTEYKFYSDADVNTTPAGQINHANIPPTEMWILDTQDNPNSEYSMPYAPFTDMDYSRGILKSTSTEDANNTVLSRTDYNWNFDIAGYTPSVIFGLKTATIEQFKKDPNDDDIDINWTAHKADRYSFISNKYRLESVTNSTYEEGSTTPLRVTTAYGFNANNDVSSERTGNSDGRIHTTEYIRLSDAILNNPSDPTLQAMVSRNMVSTVITTNSFIDGTLVGGSKVEFKNDYPNCNGCILPWKTYAFEDAWNLKSTTTDVNAHGQPVNIQREHYPDPIVFAWTSDGLLDLKRYGTWLWDYGYNSDLELTGFTDVDYQTTYYEYDGFGKLETIKERGSDRITTIEYEYAGFNNTGENAVTSTTIATGVNFIPPTKEIFDGLGRTLSSTRIGYASDGGDLVVSQKYDAFGRVERATDFTKGTPVEFTYEDSPRSRVTEQSVIGASTSVFNKYELNSANEVNGYAESTLFKATVIDENGYPSETFTDQLGRTILLRKYVDTDVVDTRYRYNNIGQLSEITQPNGEVFTYTYNAKRLLESKSVPGGGTTTYTYNDRNQVETETDGNGNIIEYRYNDFDQLTETLLDGNVIVGKTYYTSGLGSKGRLFETTSQGLNVAGSFTSSVVYDEYGRVDNETREHLNGVTDNYGYTYDHRDLTESIRRNHQGINGTVSIFTNPEYDHGGRLNYTEFGINQDPREIIAQNFYHHLTDKVYEKNLGVTLGQGQLQSIDYEYNYRGWLTKINDVGECSGDRDAPQVPNDTKPGDVSSFQQGGTVLLLFNGGEIASSAKTNIELSYTMEASQNGSVVYETSDNSDINIGGIVASNTTNYTHNREYIIDGEIDSEAMASIMTNDIVGDANSQGSGSSVSQERGAEIRTKLDEKMRRIPDREDCQNTEGDLFAQELYYHDTPEFHLTGADAIKKQYNGNISMIKWNVMLPGRNEVNYYGYDYDGIYNPSDLGANSSNNGLGRLTEAHYAQKTLGDIPQGGSPWINQGRYDVTIGYEDNAGNIGSILRNGVTGGTGTNLTYGVTDDLTFDYVNNNKNRLNLVNETGNFDHGFKTNLKGYSYDNNGNISNVSGQGAITYNHFNLPETITTAGGTISYFYDGLGRKLSKTGENGTRQYVDGIEYVNGSIEAIYHSEGRYLFDEDEHEYVIRDHLGNSRVMFRDTDNSDDISTDETYEEVVQENHYYPFGMKMEGDWADNILPANNYLYNGKELNTDFDLNWSDYGARYYDPAIARWGQVDPLAEKMASWSPYNYTFNNPISFIDPDGMSPDWVPDKDGNLIAQNNDNEKTLAKFLNISENEALKLLRNEGFISTKKNKEVLNLRNGDKLKLDNIFTRAIKDANNGDIFSITKEEYEKLSIPDGRRDARRKSQTEGYNCFGACIESSLKNRTPTGGDGIKRGLEFDNLLRKNYKATIADLKFGETLIRFDNNRTKDADHGAVFYGMSNSGDIYIFTKNGWYDKPKVMKLNDLYIEQPTYGYTRGLESAFFPGFYNIK